MRKFVVILIVLLFSHAKNIYSASTEIHFIMNDPLAGSFYRGFQVGVKTSNAEGEEAWYARVRFSDYDDQICQGKSIMSTREKVCYGLGGGAIIGALSHLCLGKQNNNNIMPYIISSGIALTSAAFIGTVCPYIYDSLGHFKSKVFMKYKVPNTQNVIDSSLLTQEDISITPINSGRADTDQPSQRLIAFGWVLKETIDLNTLIHKINEMKNVQHFPKYTLYGVSCFSDAMNCVSFCIRLGNILGIPFEENNDLQMYIKSGILPLRNMLNAAATPERIARILLEDAHLCGNGLDAWVNSDCSWWINTTMEKQAKSHVKKKRAPGDV